MIKLIAIMLLAACSSGPKDGAKYDESKLPAAPSCVVKVPNTIKVKGVLDGRGCLYKWTGKYADKCHSEKEYSEDVPRMFELEKGATLKNMQIECAPDGILMGDNTTIDKVLVRDCEEDCVTTKGKNLTIKNSKFYFGQDKCMQMSESDGVTMTNNEFHYCGRGISGSNGNGARNVVIENNRFYKNDIAIRAQSNHEFYIKNLTCEGGNEFLETSGKSVIYDGKGHKVKDCEYFAKDGTKNIKEWK